MEVLRLYRRFTHTHTQLCHIPSVTYYNFTYNTFTHTHAHNFVTYQSLTYNNFTHTNLTYNNFTHTHTHTISHPPSFRVAGVALMALGGALGLAWSPVTPGTPRHFAWQAWHNLNPPSFHVETWQVRSAL